MKQPVGVSRTSLWLLKIGGLAVLISTMVSMVWAVPEGSSLGAARPRPQTGSPSAPQTTNKLSVEFLTTQQERSADLKVSVTANLADFFESGEATMEVRSRDHLGLPTRSLKVPYTITGGRLRASISFSRSREAYPFFLTLRVKNKSNREQTFFMAGSDTISPFLATTPLTIPILQGGDGTISILQPPDPDQREPQKPDRGQEGENFLTLLNNLQSLEKLIQELPKAVEAERIRSLPPVNPQIPSSSLTTERFGMGILGIVGVLIVWWLRSRGPKLVHAKLEQKEDKHDWEVTVRCTIRQRTILSLEWNTKENIPRDDLPKVSYVIKETREGFAKVGQGQRVSIPLGSRLMLLPQKRDLLLLFHSPSSTGLPSRHNLSCSIVWEKKKRFWERLKEMFSLHEHSQERRELLWRQDIALVFGQFSNTPPLQQADQSVSTQRSSYRNVGSGPKTDEILTALQPLAPLPSRIEDLEQLVRNGQQIRLSPPAPSYQLPTNMTEQEAALLATINRWWQEDGQNQQNLIAMLGDISLSSARFFTATDLENSFHQATPLHIFVPKDRDGEWLWYEQSVGNEIAAVPVHGRFFFGDSLIFVRRMFEGCEAIASPARFACAYRACRLRRVPDQPGKYEIVARGHLQLDDSRPPDLQPPPSYKDILAHQKSKHPQTVSLADAVGDIFRELEEIKRRLSH